MPAGWADDGADFTSPLPPQSNFLRLFGQLVSDVSDTFEISVVASGWVTLWVDSNLTIWAQIGRTWQPGRTPEASEIASGDVALAAGRGVSLELRIDLNRVSTQSYRLRAEVLAVLQWRSEKLCSEWGEPWSTCRPRPIPQRNLVPLPCASGALVGVGGGAGREGVSSTNCRCPVDRQVPRER